MTDLEPMNGAWVHPQAIVETTDIGEGTRVWAFAHVMDGAQVGRDCNVGEHCFIESGASLGDAVTLKNGAMVWDGISIEDGAFIGPGVLLTNDPYPRSARLESSVRHQIDGWLVPTRIGHGASIGAGAIITPGADIGDFAMVAAGSVVTRPVGAHALVRGTPAIPVGWVCSCGLPIDFTRASTTTCGACGRAWSEVDDGARLEEAPA